MLELSRYLLGVAELGAILGFAWLGASALRARLLPDFSGAPTHLASAVLALALLILAAQILGTLNLFKPAPYIGLVAAIGVGGRILLPRVAGDEGAPAGRSLDIPTLAALAIATIAFIDFASGARLRLDTGMTGFDSTWYHGPFAAGFFQTGDTWSLHFIAPQFLAWFYPANAEVFHAVGMNAFDRDLLSPLLNLAWFLGCLLACWCIGRPSRVEPWSLALGALALSVPALSDQAGEARNDLVALFFLLAAVAIALNAWSENGKGEHALPLGAAAVAGLAAGLAAGTKLNFLLPCVVFVIGLAVLAPRGRRLATASALLLAGLAGGGYWYLRNLVQSGNPLPWFDQLGPISLPAPAQELGGREQHSVFGYLLDGSVWSDWFLPGLHDGLGSIWPLLVAMALGALLMLCLGRDVRPLGRLIGAVGLAAALAWLIAPTSASGPEGMPRGFESGLRYLSPALVLGLCLLPTLTPFRERALRWEGRGARWRPAPRGRALVFICVLLALAAVAIGYPIQRDYVRDRYAHPDFTSAGLDAAFKWARSISGARIATTSTRQYPLFGTDLSNEVQFVGLDRPHGGFIAPTTCRAWRRALNAGAYDYVVTTYDRLEKGKPPYPPTARWTEAPNATLVLRKPPTAVFKLEGSLDPSACGEDDVPAGGRGSGGSRTSPPAGPP